MIQLQFRLGGYGDGYSGDAIAPPSSSVMMVAPQAVENKQSNKMKWSVSGWAGWPTYNKPK